jgi:hypothetical protein
VIQPCRAAGVCFALHELTRDQFDATNYGELLAAADSLGELRKAILKESDGFTAALESISRVRDRLAEGDRSMEFEGRRHLRDLTFVFPQLIFSLTGSLLTTLAAFEAGVRSLPSGGDLRQPTDQNTADLLLTAVYQHLRWGGLKFPEIARLIPDGKEGGDPADRARKRIDSADARSRSLLPFEPEPVPTGSTQRRRSSG